LPSAYLLARGETTPFSGVVRLDRSSFLSSCGTTSDSILFFPFFLLSYLCLRKNAGCTSSSPPFFSLLEPPSVLTRRRFSPPEKRGIQGLAPSFVLSFFLTTHDEYSDSVFFLKVISKRRGLLPPFPLMKVDGRQETTGGVFPFLLLLEDCVESWWAFARTFFSLFHAFNEALGIYRGDCHGPPFPFFFLALIDDGEQTSSADFPSFSFSF